MLPLMAPQGQHYSSKHFKHIVMFHHHFWLYNSVHCKSLMLTACRLNKYKYLQNTCIIISAGYAILDKVLQQLFWRWVDIAFGRLFPLVWLAHSFRKGVFAELVIEDSLREPNRNVTIACWLYFKKLGNVCNSFFFWKDRYKIMYKLYI